jgi:hypothetical protein
MGTGEQRGRADKKKYPNLKSDNEAGAIQSHDECRLCIILIALAASGSTVGVAKQANGIVAQFPRNASRLRHGSVM